MLQIRITDEALGGGADHGFDLTVLDETLTVRELIRSRVHQEVKDFNASDSRTFRGLVEPSDAERTLNGARLNKRRTVDWEKQFDRAIEAFEKKGVLILIDDRQVSDLEEEVTLRAGSSVSFVKLVPLIGG